eukprot:TRINITY_DN26413_c0_g1_i1.p2 TRINITY_DN26413_c0_g1~~TRINITY_DN26413_c0_g1_i1.p2  ORF type:complete len:140 (+),score=3.14 TRINITY_DN26413_c0_g1_i1:214-633(+)
MGNNKMEFKELLKYIYGVYATLLALLVFLKSSLQEILIILGVCQCDAVIELQETARVCTIPSQYCKPCTLDPSLELCSEHQYIEPCGFMRLNGIFIAIFIPVLVFSSIMAIIVHRIQSISWNIMLAILYLQIFCFIVGV